MRGVELGCEQTDSNFAFAEQILPKYKLVVRVCCHYASRCLYDSPIYRFCTLRTGQYASQKIRILRLQNGGQVHTGAYVERFVLSLGSWYVSHS